MTPAFWSLYTPVVLGLFLFVWIVSKGLDWWESRRQAHLRRWIQRELQKADLADRRRQLDSVVRMGDWRLR